MQSRASLATKKYGPSQLREDAKILDDVVMEMHPAVGIYRPREYYNGLFTRFEDTFRDSMTEREFRLRTKLALDELHCGHTEVLYSSRFYREMNRKKLNYSPYIFLPVGNKVYMIAKEETREQVLEIALKMIHIPVVTRVAIAYGFVIVQQFAEHCTVLIHWWEADGRLAHTGWYCGWPDYQGWKTFDRLSLDTDNLHVYAHEHRAWQECISRETFDPEGYLEEYF